MYKIATSFFWISWKNIATTRKHVTILNLIEICVFANARQKTGDSCNSAKPSTTSFPALGHTTWDQSLRDPSPSRQRISKSKRQPDMIGATAVSGWMRHRGSSAFSFLTFHRTAEILGLNSWKSRDHKYAMEHCQLDLQSTLWILQALGAPKESQQQKLKRWTTFGNLLEKAIQFQLEKLRISCASWFWSITPRGFTTWTRKTVAAVLLWSSGCKNHRSSLHSALHRTFNLSSSLLGRLPCPARCERLAIALWSLICFTSTGRESFQKTSDVGITWIYSHQAASCNLDQLFEI